MSALQIEPTRFAPDAGSRNDGDLAVMFTGGGARAAYQVGLIKGIARHFPDLHFQIITGVSAGAINAVFLASKRGALEEKATALERLWCELNCSSIYHFDWRVLVPFRSALASLFPGRKRSRPRGMVDTTPLRHLLYRLFDTGPRQAIRGIEENLKSGHLKSVALITMDYSTGQSVRWVQGRNIGVFEGNNRRSALTQLTAEHVLASAALPFVFPAVKIEDRWHGDGGIRLAAPLSPAVQIIGQLVNAIFLDAIDEDVSRMQRMNEMIRKIDAPERGGLRPIDLLVMRPSVDLGKLAGKYEQYLPRNLRLLMRATGAKETESPDFMSMLMFEPRYTKRLIEIGEGDVEARIAEVREFLGRPASRAAAL